MRLGQRATPQRLQARAILFTFLTLRKSPLSSKKLRPRVNGAIDLDNLSNRVLKPVFEANGMAWKGWQAYRRGLATNLKVLGVEDTTIQCILRHEDVRTTQRFYIKTAPKVAQEAMRVLEEKIVCTAVVQQLAVN